MKQSQSYTIIGVAPLLMHNGQLANPLNQYTKTIKKISSKRQKTDADFEEIARLEWYGSLYLSGGMPCIPGEILEATLVNAAKKIKKGVQAKAGLVCMENALLEYDGPKNVDALWQCDTFRHACGAIIQRARIIRTRVIFPQ